MPIFIAQLLSINSFCKKKVPLKVESNSAASNVLSATLKSEQ
jgi:hypothetical protein